MRINKEVISKLNPCKSRFDNYLSHYGSFDGTLAEFIKLSEITYDDKVWVFVRLADKRIKQVWAALTAESVLHIFESKYLNDDRPRRLIEAILQDKVTREVIDAAADATYAAYVDAAAADAADAAYAASAAYVDAAYAAYAASAAYAAYAASAAYAARRRQRDTNLELMLTAINYDAKKDGAA